MRNSSFLLCLSVRFHGCVFCCFLSVVGRFSGRFSGRPFGEGVAIAALVADEALTLDNQYDPAFLLTFYCLFTAFSLTFHCHTAFRYESVIHTIDWHRVVCDEAAFVKNVQTGVWSR